jgi:glycosyltransferase involved in cell wall biosynthesis
MTMHIAHLLRKYNPAEWGGTETVMRQLCDGLRRQGVDSTVFCPEIPPVDVPDPLAESGCRLRRFKACVPVWGISAEQRRQMVAVGGNLLSFDLPRMLWADRSISVIHTHTLGRIGGIGLTLARRKRVPLVLTIHGGVYDLPESLKKSFAEGSPGGVEWGKPFGLLFRARRVLHEADAILTCNVREAQLIRERHPDRRVIVQPHGVNAKVYAEDHRAAALEAFPQIRGRDVILSLGRIDAVKNQGWVVEQLPQVLAAHPNALLVLAGACTDEVYGAAMQRRIEELGLSQRVLITGKLPPADPRLVGLLQVARVAMLQSVSETFGLVILEAWAAGTPAISSRTSGASALIDHGRNGWLFDLNAPASFHEALRVALTDEAARARAIEAGRERVINEYDTQVLAARVRKLYETLVEEKNALRHSA